jgi:hypothetical protein
MFRLVMNPKMKNSAVTVMNGTRYPGDVRAADFLVSAAIKRDSPFLQIRFLPGLGCFLAT